MRPLLRALLLAATAAPLAACAFGESAITPLTQYDLDLAQLRTGCEGRHGILVNSGRITGAARTETLCMIVNPPATQRVAAQPKKKAAPTPAVPATPTNPEMLAKAAPPQKGVALDAAEPEPKPARPVVEGFSTDATP